MAGVSRLSGNSRLADVDPDTGDDRIAFELRQHSGALLPIQEYVIGPTYIAAPDRLTHRETQRQHDDWNRLRSQHHRNVQPSARFRDPFAAVATHARRLLFRSHDSSGLHVPARLDHRGIEGLKPVDSPSGKPRSHGIDVKGRHGVLQAGPRTRLVSAAFPRQSFREPWRGMPRSTTAAASSRLPFRTRQFLSPLFSRSTLSSRYRTNCRHLHSR